MDTKRGLDTSVGNKCPDCLVIIPVRIASSCLAEPTVIISAAVNTLQSFNSFISFLLFISFKSINPLASTILGDTDIILILPVFPSDGVDKPITPSIEL